jgi:hypothetical protein
MAKKRQLTHMKVVEYEEFIKFVNHNHGRSYFGKSDKRRGRLVDKIVAKQEKSAEYWLFSV